MRRFFLAIGAVVLSCSSFVGCDSGSTTTTTPLPANTSDPNANKADMDKMKDMNIPGSPKKK